MRVREEEEGQKRRGGEEEKPGVDRIRFGQCVEDGGEKREAGKNYTIWCLFLLLVLLLLLLPLLLIHI